MRKNLITLLFTLLFCLLWVADGYAQRPPPKRNDTASQMPSVGSSNPMAGDDDMAGGYTARKVTDKEVLAAVKKGIALKAKEMKTKYKLETLFKAESQVVAGTNYRVCMSIALPRKGGIVETFKVNAVIFKSLENAYKVMLWEQVDSCETVVQ
ncbi:MAG: cystatin domain-containing protein [Pyrinomonadaceae bacterium]|nr:cystatin domain-containing protein [Pyrinomonadaceae bacterium]